MTKDNSPFPAGSKVAAYLRDSGGDDQDQSIGQQERVVVEWCEKNQLELTQIFRDEARSGGSTIGRDAFQEMISYFHGKNLPEAGIVVWSFARFSRSIDDSQFFKADLRRRGYIIHSLTDSLPEGLIGKFIEAAVEWKDQEYIERLSKEIRRGQYDLIHTFGALGGNPPFGFIRAPINLGKRRDGSAHIVHKWVIDPEKVDIIRSAFKMRAAGSTYKQIYVATHIYKSLQSFKKLFKNRIYIGELIFSGEVIPNYVDAIIDRATWDVVQKQMKVNAGNLRKGISPMNHPRRVNSQFLLSGLVFCEECGSLMLGHSMGFAGKEKYYYYKCGRACRTVDCSAHVTPAKLLEEIVLDKLRDYILTPSVADLIRKEITGQKNEKSIEFDTQVAEANRELGKLRNRISNILNSIEQNPNSNALAKRLSDLEQEEADLLLHVKYLEGKRDFEMNATDEEMFSQFLRTFEKGIDLPPDELRFILRGFVSKVTIKRDNDLLSGMIYFYTNPQPNSGKLPFL